MKPFYSPLVASSWLLGENENGYRIEGDASVLISQDYVFAFNENGIWAVAGRRPIKSSRSVNDFMGSRDWDTAFRPVE